MQIYILLILYVLLLILALKIKIIKPKAGLIAAFVVLTFVVGFRGSTVGEDTLTYLNIATGSAIRSWQQIISEFPNSIWGYTSWGGEQTIETGYLLFNKVIMSIWNNEQVVLLIVSLLTSLGVARFIWLNSEDCSESTWIYMCESLFLTSFNLSRQMLAIAIAIQSFYCMKNNKKIKAVVWILLASTIHISSIACFLLIPLYQFAKRRDTIKYVTVVSILIPLLLPIVKLIVSYVLPAYSRYFSNNYWETQLGGTLLLWLLLSIGITVMAYKGIEQQEHRFLVMCGIIYICLEFTGLQISAMTRIALFFRAFLILLYPVILIYFVGYKHQVYKFALNSLVLLLFISGFSSQARLYVPFWLN